MALLWPIAGGRAQWAVYRDAEAHVLAGEFPADDLGNQEGLAVLAVEDGRIVPGTGYDPDTNDGRFHAGNVVVLQGAYRSHYCHLQAIDVSIGQSVKRGDVLGFVGHTGTVIPAGVAGAHLHYWLEAMNGGWQRVTEPLDYLEGAVDKDMAQAIAQALWEIKTYAEGPQTKARRAALSAALLEAVVVIKVKAGLQ